MYHTDLDFVRLSFADSLSVNLSCSHFNLSEISLILAEKTMLIYQQIEHKTSRLIFFVIMTTTHCVDQTLTNLFIFLLYLFDSLNTILALAAPTRYDQSQKL